MDSSEKTSEATYVVASHSFQDVRFLPKFHEYLNISAPSALCVNWYWPFDYENASLS